MALVWTKTENGIKIQGSKRFGRQKSWSKIRDEANPDLLLALSRLEQLVAQQDGTRFVSSETERALFLNHALLAALPESDAAPLGLPPPVKLGLRFKTQDQVMSERFRVIAEWVRPGGFQARAAQEGALLTYEGQVYRIPLSFYDLIEAAAPLGGAMPEHNRIPAYSAFGGMLREQLGADLEIDDYLEQVTVYHAAAFSLSLTVSDDRFQFDPVLFERSVQQDYESGEVIDETSGCLLSPHHQDLFARDRFIRFQQGRSAYALDGGSFVLIDPSLQPALNVVREVASSDTETQKRFVANPTGYISERLPELQPESLAALFIETEQYSERVTGIDVWRQPVLPWLKPIPNSWLPERFGLKIGDDIVEVPPEDVPVLKEAFDEAKASGREILDWAGHQVPVSEQASEAIDSLVRLNEASSRPQAGTESETAEPPLDLAEKRFLTISDNLETVSYEAPLVPAARPQGTVTPPSSLKAILKSYQVRGFNWLVAARQEGYPGVLLADDMGLGKTLQALTFLAWLRAQQSTSDLAPVLIVAPTGLLDNWRAEIGKHFEPGAFGDIIGAYGQTLKQYKESPRIGREIDTGRTSLDLSEWSRAGVVLTTYETMRDYHFSFAKLTFEAILFDEIQKLKNPASQLSRASKSLNGRIKIGLSGTPVENRMQDLWSIMDTLWPGRLGASRDFEAQYPADNAERLEELHQALFVSHEGAPSLALRRMKSDELDGLPVKTETLKPEIMPPGQAARYQEIVSDAIQRKGQTLSRGFMLKVIQDMRSVSLHPEPPETGYEDMQAYVQNSARLKAMDAYLREVKRKSEKALVFVENLEMQAFLADYIYRELDTLRKPFCISGKVAGQKRQAFVDEFQRRPDGFDVMILSPKAGGVGLTITRANHVIHLSRWWNPAIEDQSTDRAYRIGQEKPVTVFYPQAVHPSPQLGAHSFDLRLADLLARKRALAGRMLVPPESGESDAAAMFEDVLQLAGERAPSVDEGVQAAPQFSPGVPPKRPILSLPKRVNKKPVFNEVTSRTENYREFPEGASVDFDWVFGDIAEWKIERVSLIDPYGVWSRRALKAAIRVYSEITKRAKLVHTVYLEFLPPQRVNSREFDKSEDAVQKFREQLALIDGKRRIKPPRVMHKERIKTRDRDFHDRFIVIEALTPHGRIERSYEVPRGLDHLDAVNSRVSVFVKDKVLG